MFPPPDPVSIVVSAPPARTRSASVKVILASVVLLLYYMFWMDMDMPRRVVITSVMIISIIGNLAAVGCKIIIQKDSVYSSLSLFLIIEKKLITDKKFILDHFDLIINQGSLKKEDTNLLKLKKAIYISEIDKEGEIIDLGVLSGIVEKSGSWYSYKGERIGQGRENAKKYLLENKEISSEIENLIRGKNQTVEDEKIALEN